jgi:hypothetical protein
MAAVVTAQAAGRVAALYEICRGRGAEEAALPAAARPGRLSLGGRRRHLRLPDRGSWSSQLLNHSQRSMRCPHLPSGPTSPRPPSTGGPAASRGNHPCARPQAPAKVRLGGRQEHLGTCSNDDHEQSSKRRCTGSQKRQDELQIRARTGQYSMMMLGYELGWAMKWVATPT